MYEHAPEQSGAPTGRTMKTADQKKIDDKFYAKYDAFISPEKEVTKQTRHLLSSYSILIGLEMLVIWYFNIADVINSSPNADIYRLALGIINIAMGTYMVCFVVQHRNDL